MDWFLCGRDLRRKRIDALVKGYHSGIQYVKGHGKSFVQLDEKQHSLTVLTLHQSTIAHKMSETNSSFHVK